MKSRIHNKKTEDLQLRFNRLHYLDLLWFESTMCLRNLNPYKYDIGVTRIKTSSSPV